MIEQTQKIGDLLHTLRWLIFAGSVIYTLSNSLPNIVLNDQ